MSFISSLSGQRTPAPDVARNLEVELSRLRQAEKSQGVKAAEGTTGVSFGQMVEDLVEGVDAKQKSSHEMVRNVMLGESDNLHQTMIATQEAGIAFNLMLEVRNKLVEGYQELMRLRV